MNFGYIDPSLQKAWEDLVKTNPSSGYMQSFFWTKFKNTLGWKTFKIGIFEKKQLIGGAIIAKFPFSPNINILYIPEGPILSYENPKMAEKMFHNLMREIDKIADLKGESLTSHLRIEPKLTKLPPFFIRFQKAPINQQPLSTLIIDLSRPEGEILGQMKPKGRYNIKVAQRHGVKIFKSGLQSGLGEFLKIYNRTVKRQDFAGKDKGYFERLVYALSDYPAQAGFFFAKNMEKTLAAALILYWGDTATFLFGASTNLDRNLMSSYLLHWEIIKEAKELGLKWYDFYGISPEEDNYSHPWHGFTVFKRKFGGQKIDYIGAYDFIYNQKLYEEYLKESEEV